MCFLIIKTFSDHKDHFNDDFYITESLFNREMTDDMSCYVSAFNIGGVSFCDFQYFKDDRQQLIKGIVLPSCQMLDLPGDQLKELETKIYSQGGLLKDLSSFFDGLSTK